MELKFEEKFLIYNRLYKEIQLIIENQYNLEGVIDEYNKKSTKIIFKDRDRAIKDVIMLIKRFSKEENLDINDVKEELLSFIEEKMLDEKVHINELKEVKDIILVGEENEER